MPSLSNTVCADCGIEMRAAKTGEFAEELMSDGAPYKVWSCDRFECPRCRSAVLVNFGKQPVAEHFQAEYSQWSERASITFGGPK